MQLWQISRSQIRSGFTSLADAVAKGGDAAAEAEKITALLAERNSKSRSDEAGEEVRTNVSFQM